MAFRTPTTTVDMGLGNMYSNQDDSFKSCSFGIVKQKTVEYIGNSKISPVHEYVDEENMNDFNVMYFKKKMKIRNI